MVDAKTGSPLNIHDVTFTNEDVLRAENGASLVVNNAVTNISADPNYSTGSVLTGGTYDVIDPVNSGASTIAIAGGEVDIEGNSIIELTGVSGAGQTVNFENTETSALATLRIDATSVNSAGDFASAIAGFRGGDAIDLANVSGEQSHSYDAGDGELSIVFAAGGAAELDVSGLGASPALTFSADGGGGALVTSAMTAVLADDTSNGKDVTSDPALTGTGAFGATIAVSEGGNARGTTTVGYLRLDPQGNKSVDVLFTAPAAGTYAITGGFEGVDANEPSHTVAVEVGGRRQLR